MLREALESLLSQTEPRWEAFVFDDSVGGEGAEIVRELRDRRVHYFQNPRPLGAALNIDACFGERLAGRNGWGCLLEDDNFWMPQFLEHAADVMNSHQGSFALFNQRIQRSNGELASEEETTRGDWYCEGWIDPHDLHASLLLMEGLSNGGIIWRIGGPTPLQVGGSVKLTALHEACRSLLVRAPFWFSKKALAVWRDAPVQETARNEEANRIIGRGNQSITRFLLRGYGWDSVARALLFAHTPARKEQLVSRLLHAGAFSAAMRVDSAIARRKVSLFFKGIAARLSVKDPCREFLQRLSITRSQEDQFQTSEKCG